MAALLALVAASPARAVEVDVGVPDVQLRFDNTLRYNVGLRTDPVDGRVARNPAFGAGESSVRQGDLSMHRVDLLSELDLAWAGRHGARLSAAGWYDDAYRGHHVVRDRSFATPSTYVGGELSTYTRRRYRGPWGEVLDAFAFTTLDAGPVPVTVRAGRHALCWGESLMLGGAIHGVCFSQVPLDLAKGFATPGLEAKEMFRPLGSISAQAQLTPELSLAAQAFFEWQSYVFPEGATFLGPADFAFYGPDGVYRRLGPTDAYLANGGARRPDDLGEFGVALRWRPGWLDGTVGVYYRRFADKLGAVLLTDDPAPGAGPMSPAMPSPFRYQVFYGEGVHLVGASFAKQVLGVRLAVEADYRRDMPLVAQMLGFAVPRGAPQPAGDPVLFPHGPPRLIGNTYQARGDTLHALVNAVGVVNGGPIFSTAAWAVEVTYSRWLEVRDNPDLFFGLGHGVCRGDPALSSGTPPLAKGTADGCATRDHVAVSAGLTPTWYRAFSGVDLLAPLSASWTIRGNSPVALGGNEGSGTWGAGLAADVRNRYRFDLRYADFFGRTRDDGTMVTSANGLLAILKSRGNVTFTAKATF